MQHKEKETVQKDRADKRNQTTQNDSFKNQSSTSGKSHHDEGKNSRESQSHHGNQKQNGQSRNQRSNSQDKDHNWKNQDDSEIETPGRHEDDDENNTSKKIPQMKNHGK
jgi:hypothetical protein